MPFLKAMVLTDQREAPCAKKSLHRVSLRAFGRSISARTFCAPGSQYKLPHFLRTKVLYHRITTAAFRRELMNNFSTAQAPTATMAHARIIL